MDVNNKVSNILNVNITDISNVNVKQNNNVNREVTKINKENKTIQNDNKNTLNKELLDKAITEVNHKFKLANKEFSYDIHEKTNRVTVKIKDSETGEIIKEIPSEESLDLSAKIMEMAGLLIDEKS